jgi:hypothetical protein
MRVLVQNSSDQGYLKDLQAAAWTPNSAEGVAFRSSLEAYKFCRKRRLKGVKIVMKFEHSEYDLSFPVR